MINLKQIEQTTLAGFLQEALIKKVQKEDEVRFANETREPLPVYQKPKSLPFTAGVNNLVKGIIYSLMP